jgi:hypothetical protein
VTEADWLACTDPQKLLAFLRDRASQRKLRLFACACCRRIWDCLVDPRSRQAVESGERHADALAGRAEMVAAGEAAWDAGTAVARQIDPGPLFDAARAATFASSVITSWAHATEVAGITSAVRGTCGSRGPSAPSQVAQEEREAQAGVLRDLLGPLPFGPVSLSPTVLAWNEATVVRLAQAAYEERQMPEGTLDNGRRRSWRTPWRRPVARTRTFSATAGRGACMCGAAGS